MSESDPVVIVGASAAGISAARTLRSEGFAGPIALYDADPAMPYERPPLSKMMIENPAAHVGMFALLSAEDAAQLQLELHVGRRISQIIADKLALVVEGGEVVRARAILLATGGRARRLEVPGGDLAGVHVIRDAGDAVGLQRDLRPGGRVVVVGGGLIGTEAAVAVARLGCAVTWLEVADKPLADIFGHDIADALIELHQAQGIRLICRAQLDYFEAVDGRVAGVVLRDGRRIAADAVILGVGMVPAVELARDAGLEVSNGIHVDARQSSSVAGIYAAGDVAAFYDGAAARWVRHEHWQAAEQQGANAARGILGLERLPFGVSWFWSDQGAHHIEMAGVVTGDAVMRRGERGLTVFYMAGERIVGVASIDDSHAVRIGMRLIGRDAVVARDVLAAPATDLRKLLGK